MLFGATCLVPFFCHKEKRKTSLFDLQYFLKNAVWWVVCTDKAVCFLKDLFVRVPGKIV